jgi:hypothetical protein
MTPEQICKRYTSLKAKRTSDVESVWQYMERFVMPLRGKFYEGSSDDEDTPDWRLRHIYDATAPDAAGALAANLQGNLISPSVKWFDLRFHRDDLNESDQAKEWLEEAAARVFYALQESNFNLAAAECLLDLVTFGNAVLVEEPIEGSQAIEFTSVPIREAYFETGYNGRITRFYRRLNWNAWQIADKFGNDNLPRCVEEALDENKDVTKTFEIVFAVWPRDLKGATVDRVAPAPPTKLPYAYRYVIVGTQEPLADEGGYYEMPAFIPRWRTAAGSDWGYGPGLPVLSNIMTLNQAVQATLESAEKMIEPPMMTTQMGLIGNLDIRRGGLNVVADMNDLAVLPVGGDINSGIIVVDDLRGQIRRAFFEDQLELKESPAMTATEVNVRYELMQRLLGPTLARLQSDFLDPLIERTLSILIRNSAVPMPPDEARGGTGVEVEYVGPLPRSQKSDQAAAMLAWVGQIASLAELQPELLDIPDWDVLFRKVATLTGVSAKAVRSDDEIEKLRKERQQQQEQIMKMESAKAGGQAIRDIGAGAQSISGADPSIIDALKGGVPAPGNIP